MARSEWNGIEFKRVLQGGGAPHWSDLDPQIVSRHVPGGNNNVVQNMGKGIRKMSFEVWFLTYNDYVSMVGMVGVTASLQMGSGVNSNVALTNMMLYNITGARDYTFKNDFAATVEFWQIA